MHVNILHWSVTTIYRDLSLKLHFPESGGCWRWMLLYGQVEFLSDRLTLDGAPDTSQKLHHKCHSHGQSSLLSWVALFYVPQGRLYVPQGRLYVPQGRLDVPQGRLYVPQGRLYVPQGRLYVPQGRLYVPQGPKFKIPLTISFVPRPTEYACQVSSTSAQRSRSLRVLKMFTFSKHHTDERTDGRTFDRL